MAHNLYQIWPVLKYAAHSLTHCASVHTRTHTYTQQQEQLHREHVPSAEAAEWVEAVAYRCSVSHSSCWSYSEVSAQEDGEPRHSGIETEWNMRSHSKPSSPQHLKLLALPTVCEQTSSQRRSAWGARWWIVWISSSPHQLLSNA